MSRLSESDASEVYYPVRLQNSTKLELLLKNEGAECLRKTFRKLFKVTTGLPWENTAADGKFFITNYGDALGLYKPDRQIQRNTILSGSLENWDIALLAEVLIEFLGLQSSHNLAECGNIEDLRFLKNERNLVAHIGSVDISDDEFRKKWNAIALILRKFGIPAEKLEEKNVFRVIEQIPNVENTNRESFSSVGDESSQLSTELKDSGNALFKQCKIEEAIAKYTEAINLPGLRSLEDLATIYLNRCTAYLTLNNFESAKSDAKLSVLHHPTAKGYYKLAKALDGLSKYTKALKHYQTALKYDPENKHIMSCRERVKHIILQQQCSDKKEEVESSQELTEDEIIQSCRKQAAEGVAYGLFHLALKTMNGEGVKSNAVEAVRLMEKAAAQELVFTLDGTRFVDSSKAEAEHYLGMWYASGVGVPKNTDKAVKYYEAAITHGVDKSCRSLGIIYINGDGVPVDFVMAVELWKLGAYYGSLKCIEDLARHFFNERDNENAWNWFNFAVCEKSTTMEAKRCAFLNVLGPPKKFPAFNHMGFKEKLKKEVLFGRLKRFVCPQETLDLLREDAWLPAVPQGCNSQRRKFVILQHRRLLSRTWKTFKQGDTVVAVVPNPAVTETCSKKTNLLSLKPILLDEMADTKDHNYDGFVLRVTIIEDAITGYIGVPLVIEDEKGNAHRVTIFNCVINTGTIQNFLGFGCNISIVNPCVRITTNDDLPMIQVFDPAKQLFIHTDLRATTRCRFCGKTPTTVKCRKCRRCSYCSKQCLKDDYKYLKHELVCIPKL